MSDDTKSTRLTLTRNNWHAFKLKFKLAATKEKLWQYINPDTPIMLPATEEGAKPKHSATDSQNLNAMSYLADRIHDEIAWILEINNQDLNARTAFQNLKNEIGKERQTTEDAIDQTKELKLTSKDCDAFFKNVEEAVNNCRQLGVSPQEFGNKHICRILIRGLSSPDFDPIKAPLLLTHQARAWDEEDDMDQEVIKRQILGFIKEFNPQFPTGGGRRDIRGGRGDRGNRGEGSTDRIYANKGKQNQQGGYDGDKTKPHCSTCLTLWGKVRNHHSAAQCNSKGALARANAAFSSSNEDNKAAEEYLILDSGATRDMFANAQFLMDYVKFDVPRPVILGDDTKISALGKGTLVIKSTVNDTVTYAPFYNTLHVPKLQVGLISVPIMMRSGAKTEW